ncbi:MAG: prepilin-type N-terminal cleavage/methylation domain-containing protein [Myxococcales bacterium]|nr:prepilin-type N-terminal cleavage/methylation domain-containing protein [Myxococcales bacterium]
MDPRRDDTLTTSPPALRRRAGGRARRRSLGFTLIETLITLALIALAVGGVMIGFGAGRQAEVTRASNQLANTIRFAFNKARVTGTYYRLLIDIDKGTFSLQRGDGRMYLPATDRYGRIRVVDPSREKEKEERDRRAEENYNRSLQARVLAAVKSPSAGMSGGVLPQKAPAQGAPGTTPPVAPGTTPPAPGTTPGTTSTTTTAPIDKYAIVPKKVPRRKPPMFGGFEDDNSLSSLKKPFTLPKEVKIVSVRTAEDLKPITAGEASIYFFPQGTTQLAHIQIEDVKSPENSFTVIIQPLTGRVEIQEGKVELVLIEDPTSVKDDLGRRQNRRSF